MSVKKQKTLVQHWHNVLRRWASVDPTSWQRALTIDVEPKSRNVMISIFITLTGNRAVDEILVGGFLRHNILVLCRDDRFEFTV